MPPCIACFGLVGKERKEKTRTRPKLWGKRGQDEAEDLGKTFAAMGRLKAGDNKTSKSNRGGSL